jgi:hypothetical protein
MAGFQRPSRDGLKTTLKAVVETVVETVSRRYRDGLGDGPLSSLKKTVSTMARLRSPSDGLEDGFSEGPSRTMLETATRWSEETVFETNS